VRLSINNESCCGGVQLNQKELAQLENLLKQTAEQLEALKKPPSKKSKFCGGGEDFKK